MSIIDLFDDFLKAFLSYKEYNWVGKQLSRRLETLGAQLVVPTVLCDERHELGFDYGADKDRVI